MTTIAPFNVQTATAEEITAQVEKTFRAENWNHIRKLERLSDLKFSLASDGQLQYAVRKYKHGYADETNRLPDGELPAWRRYWQAQADWLIANPGDDLPVEHVAQTVKFAARDLPHCQELKTAIDWAREVDEWSEHYNSGESPMAKTPTHEKLCEKFERLITDVRERLVDILTVEDVAFLRDICGRTWRTRSRFWVYRVTLRDECGAQFHKMRFADIQLRARFGGAGGYWSAQFERCIETARTITEVKQLCAIWRTPVFVRSAGAGGRVVLSVEKSPEGCAWLMIAPIEAKQSAYDAAIAAAWGK